MANSKKSSRLSETADPDHCVLDGPLDTVTCVKFFSDTVVSRSMNSLNSRFSLKRSLDDLGSILFWKDVFMEVIVSMLLLMAITWCLVTLTPQIYVPTTTHFGIFAGVFVFSIIEGYGPISGALFNPATCWAFFLVGRISFAKLILYTVAEVAGSVTGSYIAFFLCPVAQQEAFIPIKLGPGLTEAQGVAIEGIVCFNLMFVTLSCTDLKTKTSLLPGLAIGFCISGGILAAGTHTGGLANPIVGFGPAVMARDFEHHWLYWIGPYLGATVASILYQANQFVKVVADKRRMQAEKQLEAQNRTSIQRKCSLPANMMKELKIKENLGMTKSLLPPAVAQLSKTEVFRCFSA